MSQPTARAHNGLRTQPDVAMKAPTPGDSTSLLDASASQLAAWVRAGDLSPVELVDVHIQRIEEVNPHINAVVATRYDAARNEARQAERQLVASRDPSALPPFLGVPFTAKEFLAVKGLSNSGGVLHRRAVVAAQDATLVARLRTAGAIPLGVTNVPEGGLWMETTNLIWGRTVNPWDATRTSGGSSGGEAAIISAGGVPFGMGSDIGGSIRIPAGLCGITGHKPTGRMVPNTGYWPDPGPTDVGAYLVSGPMARRAEDLWPLLQIIAGPDGVDPICRSWPVGDPASVDPKQRIVYALEDNGRVRVSDDMRQAVRDATAALVDAGATVRPLHLPALRQAFEIWGAMLNEAADTGYAEILGRDGDLRLMRELLAFPFGRSGHSSAVLILVAVEKLMQRFPGQQARLVALGRQLQVDLEEALGAHGVLIHPPYSRAAPRHRHPWLTPFDVACTCIFNVLEMPGTVVPTGWTAEGLPVGVQVLAPRGQDHRTIAAAIDIEARTGGWRRSDPQLVGR
jgi:fatty acid amide hydrolase 2